MWNSDTYNSMENFLNDLKKEFFEDCSVIKDKLFEYYNLSNHAGIWIDDQHTFLAKIKINEKNELEFIFKDNDKEYSDLVCKTSENHYFHLEDNKFYLLDLRRDRITDLIDFSVSLLLHDFLEKNDPEERLTLEEEKEALNNKIKFFEATINIEMKHSEFIDKYFSDGIKRCEARLNELNECKTPIDYLNNRIKYFRKKQATHPTDLFIKSQLNECIKRLNELTKEKQSDISQNN